MYLISLPCECRADNSRPSFMICGFLCRYLPSCVKSSRSLQALTKQRRLTEHDEACFLTVVTFKTIYEGFFKRRGVANTANFFHSDSDWGKKEKRQRGGEDINVREKDRYTHSKREKSVSCINLCTLIHIPATSLISESSAPLVWRADVLPGPNKFPISPLTRHKVEKHSALPECSLL